MQEDLYTPSLAKGEARKTKSYDINQLFIVAFFGGIVAVSMLGIRNAKWLQLEEKYIRILTAISVSLLLVKLAIVYAIMHQIIEVEGSMSRFISRALGLLCFVFFYLFLKGPFKEHILLQGETEPLLKQGILWVLLAALIEGVLIICVSVL